MGIAPYRKYGSLEHNPAGLLFTLYYIGLTQVQNNFTAEVAELSYRNNFATNVRGHTLSFKIIFFRGYKLQPKLCALRVLGGKNTPKLRKSYYN